MTTFDERERSFELKFARDAERKFRAESRRNKLLGEWAAAKLGMTGAAVEEYVKNVRKADLAAKGDDDVLQKLLGDFRDKGITLTSAELRKTMDDFMAQVVAQIDREGASGA